MLVDSHCHLDYLEADHDLDAVVRRARNAGVGAMVTICTKVSEAERIRGIAARFPNVYCSVGVHPHEAAPEGEVSAEQIVTLAAHPKVVGIGETGLDYYYEHSPREIQQESFKRHIEAAQETGLPLIVHTRDADQDTMDILESAFDNKKLSGVIHCFSASRTLAERALALDFYISLSGIVTFKSARDIQATAKAVPADRLLVETDAPYLAPVPHRGKTNEPAFVRHVSDFVADLRGVSREAFARESTVNFHRLFSKAGPVPETGP